MVPSHYEEEYFCRTCSHTACVWYVSKGKRILDESMALCSAAADFWLEEVASAVGAEEMLN
jgi:hypothetical protein